MELLADNGVLSERFVGVHLTHLEEHETKLLGAARAFACICPTTERDLGDGLPHIGAMRAAGVRLCTGIDSHVITSPLEDLRGIDLGERLRTGRRVTLRGGAVPARTPAEELWRIGSTEGAAACGFDDAGGTVVVDQEAPELALVRDEHLLDAVVYSGSRAVLRGEG